MCPGNLYLTLLLLVLLVDIVGVISHGLREKQSAGCTLCNVSSTGYRLPSTGLAQYVFRQSDLNADKPPIGHPMVTMLRAAAAFHNQRSADGNFIMNSEPRATVTAALESKNDASATQNGISGTTSQRLNDISPSTEVAAAAPTTLFDLSALSRPKSLQTESPALQAVPVGAKTWKLESLQVRTASERAGKTGTKSDFPTLHQTAQTLQHTAPPTTMVIITNHGDKPVKIWLGEIEDIAEETADRVFELEHHVNSKSTIVNMAHYVKNGDVVQTSFIFHPGSQLFQSVLFLAYPSDAYLTTVVEEYDVRQGTDTCVRNFTKARYQDDTNERHNILEPCNPEVFAMDGNNTVPQRNEECKADSDRCLDIKQAELSTLINGRKLHVERDVTVLVRCRMYITHRPATEIVDHSPLSPTAGYVSSYLFDGRTRYSRATNANFLFLISTETLMMTSLHFDIPCGEDYLALFKIPVDVSYLRQNLDAQSTMWFYNLFNYDIENDIHPTQEWKKCGQADIPTMIYNVIVGVKFYSGTGITGHGFKLLYSIHNATEAPEQVGQDFFNCSVPYFHMFQQHLTCNLHVQCINGEDEDNCSYTTITCGSGLVDVGNKCYQYIKVKGRITWYDAFTRCQKRNMRLVSPRSLEDWSAFQKVLSFQKSSSAVFVGLRTSELSLYYREVWQWADNSMAYYNTLRLEGQVPKPACAYFPGLQQDYLKVQGCGSLMETGFILCETDKEPVDKSKKLAVRLIDVNSDKVWGQKSGISMLRCPDGHVVHDFLSCDVSSHCMVASFVQSCRTPMSGSVLMFLCADGVQTVHYTLVCDHRDDCPDSSDETFCVFHDCPQEQCRNGQCVSSEQICDRLEHCVDGSDEECPQFLQKMNRLTPPPAIVRLDGHGRYTLTPRNASVPCPATHFSCSDDLCLPVYLRCNNVYDCLDGVDEVGCSDASCPGLYRCRASSVCVHADHVCDGVFQCPQKDDELLCDLKCPEGCLCQGLAFMCNQSFPGQNYTHLRYLDASGSNMAPDDLTSNFYLVSLTLSSCGIEDLHNLTLPNLRTIDLSDNKLRVVNFHVLWGSPRLQIIRLSNNPLVNVKNTALHFHFHHVSVVDLSQTKLKTFDGQTMATFPLLKTLNISHADITSIIGIQATNGSVLEVLDVRGSPMTDFPRDFLRNLPSLKSVYASNYKLCCPAMLPQDFNVKDCHAPTDEIASCDDLLRSSVFRVCLWIMSLLALAGNIGSLVTRVRFHKESLKTSFSVFVTNLNVADLVMGVYLAMIGMADLTYRGSYLWKDRVWKRSVACKLAGFLSLLSSEVSAFFICLITLDRFLALRFIFSGFRFSTRSAVVSCGIAWGLAVVLATVPLLPMTSHWEFYGQTGICIPLPVTRASGFKGHSYSFGVVVGLNFTIFIFIAIGQLLIYRTVQQNSFTSDHNSSKDATIARRLTTIVLSDFLCWFPIGLTGLLASTGTPIPGDVNVGIAIFVLPFNSALNPFLYTLNLLLEKQRKAAEARLLQQLAKRAASVCNVRCVGTMTTGFEVVDSDPAAFRVADMSQDVGEDLVVRNDDTDQVRDRPLQV